MNCRKGAKIMPNILKNESWKDVTEGSASTNSVAITNKKLKLRSFKSSEHINEKGDGPYRGFDY